MNKKNQLSGNYFHISSANTICYHPLGVHGTILSVFSEKKGMFSPSQTLKQHAFTWNSNFQKHTQTHRHAEHLQSMSSKNSKNPRSKSSTSSRRWNISLASSPSSGNNSHHSIASPPGFIAARAHNVGSSSSSSATATPDAAAAAEKEDAHHKLQEKVTHYYNYIYIYIS